MGNNNSISKISFYDMQNIVNNNYNNYIIVNTLEDNEQDCLISNTINANTELIFFNDTTYKFLDKNIIIYGKNCNCNKIYDKYQQIKKMGYPNVYLYIGGLFEWLLLQDIYGYDNFPTTKKEFDILKYKPKDIINNYLMLN
jgi:hypothetical protein